MDISCEYIATQTTIEKPISIHGCDASNSNRRTYSLMGDIASNHRLSCVASNGIKVIGVPLFFCM